MENDSIFAISRFGLNHERLRAEVAAHNIAIANTARTDANPIAALRVVVQGAAPDFAAMVRAGAASPALPLPQLAVEQATDAVRTVSDPSHPAADGAGRVQYPRVEIADEMTTLVAATRGYEANVKAINTLRAMVLKALEMGTR